MPNLTDHRVFQRELICARCEHPIAAGDEPAAGECRCGSGDVVERNYREFLPGADAVRDVRCVRHDAGALVDIPQRFVVHSPTGFEFGYGGSGPADLALNVLALLVPPQEAWRLHQRFKFDCIAKIPRDGGVIEAASVREWIRLQWEAAAA